MAWISGCFADLPCEIENLPLRVHKFVEFHL
jgi:hypothetical protein